MKSILYPFIILLLASVTAQAQTSVFKMYRFECSKYYNIKLVKPKGFKVIGKTFFFVVNKKTNEGLPYRMALESKDKDCLILFPNFWGNTADFTFSIKRLCYREVEATLNLNPETRATKINPTKYIEIISKDDMKDYCNADTVWMYKAPLPEPYKGIYTHCIGVSLFKMGHPSAVMKILLTEAGQKKAEEYLRILFKCIHYSNSDSAPTINQETRDKVRKQMKLKFFLYNKKHYFYM